jgi:hypothetical protein
MQFRVGHVQGPVSCIPEDQATSHGFKLYQQGATKPSVIRVSGEVIRINEATDP